MKDSNKFLGIDIIRVISMFCVIFLHCASNRLRVEMGNTGWNVANILTSFATCGVPMFFMISGALILGSKNTCSIKYTLKNRVLRLIIPMAVWSVIAVAAGLYADREAVLTVGNFSREIIKFFNKPVAVHLWFMYYLIPMYLISPAIKIFIDNSGDNVIKYILMLWLIEIFSLTLGGIVNNDTQKVIVNIGFINNIGFISGYLGYFILGWYLFNKDIKISNRWLILIIAASALFISAGTKMITEYNGFYTETFKSYRSIFVVILSCGMFLLLNRINKAPGILIKLISELAAVSYGVYLSHNVIINLLNRWGLKNYSIAEVFETFFITAFFSIIIIWILSKIKYIAVIFAGIKKS
ncbi:MAG: acyltransferase family protein [Clostridia bacterium]|nr:acyltransferase family protein [Clostridia bacterium]